MKKLVRICSAFFVTFLGAASLAVAQEAATGAAAPAAAPTLILAGGAVGIGLTVMGAAFGIGRLAASAKSRSHDGQTDANGAGLTVMGAAFGIGRLAASAVESMARQPEVAGSIQTAMIIAAALIEGFTFFALVICMLYAF